MKRFLLVAAVIASLSVFTTSTANADDGHGHRIGGHYNSGRSGFSFYVGPSYGSAYRYSGPVYHPPSVHYDRVYHPTYGHWTPGRGYHTHGHFDYVPHYTPGHFDYRHGNHIHANPWFHH